MSSQPSTYPVGLQPQGLPPSVGPQQQSYAAGQQAQGQYTIQKGDTFNAIAAVKGTTARILEALNPGMSATDLAIGGKMNLPGSGAYPGQQEFLQQYPGGQLPPSFPGAQPQIGDPQSGILGHPGQPLNPQAQLEAEQQAKMQANMQAKFQQEAQERRAMAQQQQQAIGQSQGQSVQAQVSIAVKTYYSLADIIILVLPK